MRLSLADYDIRDGHYWTQLLEIEYNTAKVISPPSHPSHSRLSVVLLTETILQRHSVKQRLPFRADLQINSIKHFEPL